MTAALNAITERACLRGGWPPIFLVVLTPHHFLAATSRLDHDNQIPTTEGAGQCSLLTECDHRWTESREGALKRHTSQSCLWLRQHPSHNDPGKSPSATRHSPLTHSQDKMANEADYVELGLSCADICRALERGMNGKQLDDLNQSVCDAINQLTT